MTTNQEESETDFSTTLNKLRMKPWPRWRILLDDTFGLKCACDLIGDAPKEEAQNRRQAVRIRVVAI